MLIGLWDDLKNLSPWAKFSAQTLVALGCWALGFRIVASWAPGGEVSSLGMLSLPLTLLWIVGVTNAFNLIDGMDGLAAGSSLFAMMTMLVLSVSNDLYLSAVILAALAGATLGFLRYNFHPASIFLGDSGSLLLGFMLALLALRNSQKSSTAFAIAVPIVAFGLPVLDTAMAIIRRFLSGSPIFSGDRGHIHHVLIERGLKPRYVVVLLYGVSGAFGLISLWFMNPHGKPVGLVLAILGACLWFGIQQIRFPELRGLNNHLSLGFHNQRKLIAGSVAVEKMIHEIRHARGLAQLLQGLSAAFEELSFSRFELRIPILTDDMRISLPKRWTKLHDGPGRLLLQWTSPCVDCWTRSNSKNHSEDSPRTPENDSWNMLNGYLSSSRTRSSLPCDDCREMKRSLLRKGLLAVDRYGPGEVKLEFEIRVPMPPEFQKNNGNSDVGFVTFYHPHYCMFPVSAISILSQPVWMEIERSLQRAMTEMVARYIQRRPVAV
jgi:glycosyl transferase family 4